MPVILRWSDLDGPDGPAALRLRLVLGIVSGNSDAMNQER